MTRTYRTKDETIKYFEMLADEYEKQAHRNGDDPIAYAKADAYRLAAFEVKNNME